jgi:hypothetical protein
MCFSTVFHSTIVSLFRPFLEDLQTSHLNSFSSQDSTPKAVFDASLNQLKQLILLCRLQHPRTMNTMFPNAALLQVSNTMVRDRTDPQWKDYLMLCLQSYQDLYVCFPVFEDVMQGILAMAIQNEALSSAEAREVMGKLKERGSHHETSEGVVGSFTIDFDLFMTKPDKADVHNVAQRFEEFAIFDELIDTTTESKGDL